MSTTAISVKAFRSTQSKTHWVPWYTSVVTVIGLAITFYALIQMARLWPQLLLFAAAAAIAELTSVELFANSRTRISVSSIFAITAIVTYGSLAGSLIQLTTGLVTALTTTLLQRQTAREQQRVSLLQRAGFNIGMGVISAALAGWVYGWMGGTSGEVVHWGNLFPLVLTVTIDTLVNIVLLIGVVYLQTGRSIANIWYQDFQWGIPIALLGGIIGGGGLAVGYAVSGVTGLAIFLLPILATGYGFHLYVRNSRGYIDQLETLNQNLESANFGLLHTLGAVIDAYDIYTYGHSTQVALYAAAIAEKLGLSPEHQAKIRRGGLIHDLGKVGVKDAIISKPGRLTDEEYEALKRHPVIGAEIVSQMPGLQELVPMVRSHHERWDGRGYPDGLKGEAIPFDARIMAVADSVEAMLSDRPYRPTRSLEDVVAEVTRCAGTHFDPLVSQAFLVLAAERGTTLFTNSATSVDQALEIQGSASSMTELRYLKKSMVPGERPCFQSTSN